MESFYHDAIKKTFLESSQKASQERPSPEEGKFFSQWMLEHKKMILEYEAKQKRFVRRLSFWKTSCLWLAVLMVCASALLGYHVYEARKTLLESRKATALLSDRLNEVFGKLDESQRALAAKNKQLNKQGGWIYILEQSIPTKYREMLRKEYLGDSGGGD
ncbi:MAG: hypothetical protein JSW40_09665 [Candidatus Omnitrophota bacterium]|nr:MAG: hypothetical protein JSW40_09665 [Candidatus Omnitrophota bacterium]